MLQPIFEDNGTIKVTLQSLMIHSGRLPCSQMLNRSSNRQNSSLSPPNVKSKEKGFMNVDLASSPKKVMVRTVVTPEMKEHVFNMFTDYRGRH